MVTLDDEAAESATSSAVDSADSFANTSAAGDVSGSGHPPPPLWKSLDIIPTHRSVHPDSNWNQACQREFGSWARPADWNDLRRSPPSPLQAFYARSNFGYHNGHSPHQNKAFMVMYAGIS